MSIIQTCQQLPITSKGFPNGRLPSDYQCTQKSIRVTKPKLIWAAMTVGKPGFSHIYRRGVYSLFEILNRCSFVCMNVNFAGPGELLTLSSLYCDLDPSEKGMVSYQLGMMVTKLCAHELLDTPWLVHLSWMDKQNRIKYPVNNRYRADFLGKSRATCRWSLFEAKARSDVFSQNVLNKAKQQAQMSILVDDQPKDLGVACGLFTKHHFDFHWQDSPEDPEKVLKLKTIRKTWLAYYGNVIALYNYQREFPEMGFSIGIHHRVLEFIQSLEKTGDESWKEVILGLNEVIPKPEDGPEDVVFSGMDGVTIKLKKK